MVGTFSYMVPGADKRLKFREGCVHLPRHAALLRLCPEDFGGGDLEVPQHWKRQLKHLDLALELRLQTLQSDRVLRVVVREAVDLDRRRGMIEGPLQIERKRLVGLPVE